jgi:penicillin-binding protein 2
MAKVHDTDQGRLLTRRAFLLGGAQAALFTVLAGRLYDLQILQGERYRTLAEENRISTRIILPDRGLILDRRGLILARNEVSFRAELVTDQIKDPRATLRQLYGLLPFEDWERRRIEKDLRRRTVASILVRDNLSWDELSLLELHTPDLPGLAIEAGQARSYPSGEATAHILGYTGPPSEKEAGDDPLLNHPGFRIGKGGLEKIYEPYLRGIPGSEQVEVNVHGRPVRDLARRDGIRGNDLKLTLDMELQEFTQKRLTSEQSASAVVMDAQTGSLYALCSHPTFDANLFTRGISKNEFKRLNEDPLKPLLNKAIMGLYAPGSTFKVAMALTALETGVSPNTRFYCPGHLDLGNHRFHCWKRGGHGNVDLYRAITQSCDVFFYRLSQKVGIDAIEHYARLLGLGAKTGLDLPNEKSGLMPNRAWKKKRFKQEWSPGETLIASIGQGYMLSTTLQLAVMTARIANGGRAVVPHVMESISETVRARESFPGLPVNPANLAFIRTAMAGVCQPGGTAYGARIDIPGYEIGGKTGTSQVRRITRAERATGVIPNEKRPWDDRDHALFISFAPAHAPRYVAAVIVDHGGGGSKVAAPIARDILIQVQRIDPAKALVKPLVIPQPAEQQPPKQIFAPQEPEDDDMLPDNDMLPGAMPDDE